MPEIVVRALEPEDVPAVNAIHNQRSVAAMTLQIPFHTAAERVERMISTASQRFIIAEIDGVIVGMAGLHLSSRRMAHVGSIGMAVHEDYQGRGVGTALLATLIDLADNWYNLRRLELHVYTDNEAAIRLYEASGFEIEGTHRAYAFRLGGYADAYSMARLRNEPPIV